MTGTNAPLQAWVTLKHPAFSGHGRDIAFLTCASDFDPGREFFIVLFFHGFAKVGGGGKTFCNIYVYDVCDTAGVYIPRVW